MGILRTDIVSHSQLEGTGSVVFDGVGDYLTFAADNAFTAGSADVTFELWVYLTDSTDLSSGNYYLFDMGANGYRIQIYQGTLYFGDGSNTTSGSGITKNAWHHVAGIRDGNFKFLYLDGNLVSTNACSVNHSTNTFTIGSYSTGGGDYEPYGYISNFRYVRGVVYKGEFTPPKFELKNIPGTIVLGCQSTTSATDFAVTPSTITANGDAASSAFHPGLKKDIIDTGVVFDGVTTFDSQAYMVPPSGKTTERNRGRGLIGQGKNTTSPNNMKAISFIEIQSGGTAFDFGDSTNGSMYAMTAVSSSTRAVFAGGHTSQASPYPTTNLLEFVTIANTSNCTDFGDLAVAAANRTGASNQTRGLIAGGYSPNTRQIDKIEIATLGNATDYGDLTDQGFYGLNQGGMVSSTTRGVYAGGSGNSAPVAVNTITFSLFSTSGDSTDFGDLTHTNGYFNVGNSNGVRGVFMGGADIDSPYAVTDQIDFITIATAGNATDFGSLSTARYVAMGASNSTRGVIAGGRISPAPSLPATNLMEFINIASTGNGAAFGELIEPERTGAGCSDSHGGLE